MSKKIKILWIDDLPSRQKVAENLEKNLSGKLSFKNVHNKDIDHELKNILQTEDEPELIVLDHRLEESSGIFKVGSTVAALLREQWPRCPIIGITAANISVDVNFQQREAYEEIFSSLNFNQNYDTIRSIVRSFNRLKEYPPKSMDEILQMLKAPQTDQKKINAIFPQQLRENISDATVLVDISRWTRRIFLGRPGFVYDRLWSATLLGLTLKGFGKVEHLFKSATYSGIFADDSNPNWWKSKIMATLNKLVDTPGLPWEKGRCLDPDFRTDDFSVCYQSGEDYPEIVAYVDSSITSERHPMKSKYTNPHPAFEDMLYFEEIRMMKPA